MEMLLPTVVVPPPALLQRLRSLEQALTCYLHTLPLANQLSIRYKSYVAISTLIFSM